MAWTPVGGRTDRRGRRAGAAPRAAPPSGCGPRLRRSATCRPGGATERPPPLSGTPALDASPPLGPRLPPGSEHAVLGEGWALRPRSARAPWTRKERGAGRSRSPVERGVWILLPSSPPCTVPGGRGGSQPSRGNSPGDGDCLHLRPVQHNLPLSKSVLIFKHLA